MRNYAVILTNYPDAIKKKILDIYWDQRLTEWQRYLLLLYVILPIVFLIALIIGFALSVYYQGWVNFKYVARFTPAPYQPGDIIHHYK
jgi:hypothetical protein